ncbi:hypothetical protein CRUP_010117 [Coryphaenoides rupestris]|nr:hypothetical protein CRUP_010117 [Coryphaenoides rupestris]
MQPSNNVVAVFKPSGLSLTGSNRRRGETSTIACWRDWLLQVEDAPAPVVPAKAKKTKKPAANAQKKVGPSVTELIVAVVAASKERSGVSVPALKKALDGKGYDVEKNNSRLAVTLCSPFASNITFEAVT